MKKFLTVVAVVFSLPVAAETNLDKLYMPNDAGGFVVLTLDTCKESANQLFPHHTYATDGNGNIIETGCWQSPDASNAVEQSPPGAKIIYLFNLWYSGNVYSLPQNYFSPKQERWTDPRPEGNF